MLRRRSIATVSVIVGALGGCATGPGEHGSSGETPADDQPLDLAIDALDIVHGALRLTATMVDGAADLSVRLGGSCEHREVGGGLSTPSTLVWSLGDSEVAEAIGCGLAVRARLRDRDGSVNKVANLDVTVDVAAEADNPEDGPQLQTFLTSELGLYVVFAPVTRRARLITGDSILEGAWVDSEHGGPAGGDDSRQFVVPWVDFARSVLRRRPLHLDGSSFVTSLSVGGTSLPGEPPESGPSTQDPAENATPEELPEEG
jgi:hypothetical protein